MYRPGGGGWKHCRAARVRCSFEWQAGGGKFAATAASAGGRLCRLPFMFQRLSRAQLHLDGGVAAMPGVRDVGSTFEGSARGDERLGSDGTIPRRSGHSYSLGAAVGATTDQERRNRNRRLAIPRGYLH